MTIFADPVLLTIIAFLAALGVFVVSKRAGILLGIVGIAFLYLAATPLVSHRLLSSFGEGRADATLSEAPEANAIVILGADIRRGSPEIIGDTVGRLSLERVRYGAQLYRETNLPILTTGGKIGDSQKSVAKAMAEALRNDFQVPVRWVEESARNTFENAQRSADVLRANHVDVVYLVTHSWHMPRALEAFQEVGVAVIPRPISAAVQVSPVGLSDFVPNSGALRNSAFAMHEWIGRYWYRVRYY